MVNKNVRGRKKPTREEREISSLTKFSVEQTKLIRENGRRIGNLTARNKELRSTISRLEQNRWLCLNLVDNDYGMTRTLRLETDLPRIGVEINEIAIDRMRISDHTDISPVFEKMLKVEFPKLTAKLEQDFREQIGDLIFRDNQDRFLDGL